MGDLKYFATAIFLLVGLFSGIIGLLAFLFHFPGLEILMLLSLASLTTSLILFLKKKMTKF